MKKTLFLLTALQFYFVALAQNDFRKGYFIDNQGVKKEGYLKSSNFRTFNDDYFKNFEFKIDLEQPEQTIEKFDVTEFGIENEVKYQKMKAMLDNVSFFKEYTDGEHFLVKEKTVFLEVLLEGKATLYSYDGGQGTKYLWKIADEGEVATQFLYKHYFKKPKMNQSENSTFREQLFNHVRCPGQKYKYFLNVKYDEQELIALFKKYNNCNKSSSIVYEFEKEPIDKWRFSLLVGYNFGAISIDGNQNSAVSKSIGMVSIGGEAEFLLASKVASFFVSTEYKNAKGDAQYIDGTSQASPAAGADVFTYKLNNTMFDVIIGGRWYKNFSNGQSLFLGGGVGINYTHGEVPVYRFNNFFTTPVIFDKQKLGFSPFMSFHLGYLIKNKYGVDLNWDTNKNLFQNSNMGITTKLSEVGINLKYIF